MNDLEEFESPPIHAKVHPPGEMDDAKPTLDDADRHYLHHPNDQATTEFDFEPEAADAAADLAGDLGSQFLEGATRGEDLSDRMTSMEDLEDSEGPFLIEEEEEERPEGSAAKPEDEPDDRDLDARPQPRRVTGLQRR